jgi:putative ABC transport system permease protein
LVRLSPGVTPEQFRFVAARASEVKVVAGNGMTTSVRQGLTTVLNGAVVLTVLALLGTALMVGAMYTGMLGERRRELGLLLAAGMRPGQLVRLIVAEAVLTTGLGGVSGVVLGAAGLAIFQRSWGHRFESYQVPFALPAGPEVAATGLVSIVLCCGVGLAGALLPAWRLGRREPYELIRGGDV